MARGKSTTTGTRTRTTTQRVTSLEPRAGKQLTSLEEAVVRMHHGVSVKSGAKLATNAVSDDPAVSDDLADRLLDMELNAFIASGRSEDLPSPPKKKGAKVARIVDELKKRR